MNKPQRLNRRVIYENPWVNLYVDRVAFPDGRIIEEHHLLDFTNEAVSALVVREDGALLLVEAFRYTTDSIGWETPAGVIEANEGILAAAAREVFEETGYLSADHTLIYTFNPMNGISNMVFHLVRCRVTEQVADFDRNEVSGHRWFTPGELQELIDSATVRDGYTMVGVLLHLNALDRGRQE